MDTTRLLLTLAYTVAIAPVLILMLIGQRRERTPAESLRLLRGFKVSVVPLAVVIAANMAYGVVVEGRTAPLLLFIPLITLFVSIWRMVDGITKHLRREVDAGERVPLTAADRRRTKADSTGILVSILAITVATVVGIVWDVIAG